MKKSFNYNYFSKKQLINAITALPEQYQEALQASLLDVMDLLEQCDQAFDQAVEARKELSILLKPYAGKPIEAIPKEVTDRVAAIEAKWDKAWKEYLRLDKLIDRIDQQI